MDNNARSYLMESLLGRYYLIDSIIGPFITEEQRRGIYDELLKVYCITPDALTEEYYRVSNSKEFREIDDLPSYERLCRLIEYAQLCGHSAELTDVDRVILAQKREAMMIRSEVFKQGKNLTAELIYETLLKEALNGNVQIMTVLAYMEYHGICICTDRNRAIKRIRLCGAWNDLLGNLMGIAYDGENSERYFSTLSAVLRTTGQRRIFEGICSYYGRDTYCPDFPVARIMEKAFALNVIDRSRYDRNYAKVAFSRVISVEDKEKLLLDRQKDALLSLTGIPFDVSGDERLELDRTCLDKIPLERANEKRRILQNVTVGARKPNPIYTPLLVVSGDGYVTDMYKEGLRQGFRQSRVIEVDASTLTYQDFAPGRENLFLRGMTETKQYRTVFFITGCESLEEEQLEELCKMLDFNYRKKFKLIQPTISLDLSGVLIVLFATERKGAVSVLEDRCDTVLTERVTKNEKDLVIEALFDEGFSALGWDRVPLEEGCKEYLSKYPSNEVCRIVDYVLQSAIYENAECITVDLIRSVCSDRSILSSRKGFGYVGGNDNA